MVAVPEHTGSPLLAPDEPAPVELIEVDGKRPLVLACDHASNRVPRSLDSMGLDGNSLENHIGWDIGAGAVTRLLSERLQASAVLGGYSRLVMDLNRDLYDPTAFPEISDGVLIPANLGLSVEVRAERARALFKPYHETLRRVIQARTTQQQTPVMICIHSFTPYQYNVLRPWHAGVLWDKDPRLALPLIAALRETADIVVGDNEPYSGHHPADYTVDHHAETLGLAYAAIEIRQDLIEDESGQQQWADRLAKVLDELLLDQRLFQPLAG
jgi:predicted N-formylglutamate amidohydrolase